MATDKSQADHYAEDLIDLKFVAAGVRLLGHLVSKNNVLNLGVGYGIWDAFLVGNCARVTSVDISNEILRTAQLRYPSIEYILCDVMDFTPDSRYNTIVCSHFLEHLESPVEALRLMASWLVPGGRILIIVPNALSIHRRLGVQMGLLGSPYELNESDLLIGHKRVYDLSALKKHVEESGLKTVMSRSFTLKTIANSMYDLVGESYLAASLDPSIDWGESGGQLALVAEVEQ